MKFKLTGDEERVEVQLDQAEVGDDVHAARERGEKDGVDDGDSGSQAIRLDGELDDLVKDTTGRQEISERFDGGPGKLTRSWQSSRPWISRGSRRARP